MLMRVTLPFLLLLLFAGRMAAQDTPLSSILIEGEGWKKQILPGRPGGSSPALPGDSKAEIGYKIVDKQVVRKSAQGDVKISLPEKLSSPSGLTLWPDGGTLVVGDAEGKHLWAFRVEKEGSLSDGDRYYALRMKPGEKASHVTALTVDDKGRLYACTPLGIQVFDPTGRLCGVIVKPGNGEMTHVNLSGVKGDELYVLCGCECIRVKSRGKTRIWRSRRNEDSVHSYRA